MRSTKRRPSPRRESARKQENYALDPYLLDEVAFTLDEIRRARNAA